MIIVLSPILSHVGYGLSWQNMLVMSWGGLRGAVGICLSLQVFTNREICQHTEIGPKVIYNNFLLFCYENHGLNFILRMRSSSSKPLE